MWFCKREKKRKIMARGGWGGWHRWRKSFIHESITNSKRWSTIVTYMYMHVLFLITKGWSSCDKQYAIFTRNMTALTTLTLRRSWWDPGARSWSTLLCTSSMEVNKRSVKWRASLKYYVILKLSAYISQEAYLNIFAQRLI